MGAARKITGALLVAALAVVVHGSLRTPAVDVAMPVVPQPSTDVPAATAAVAAVAAAANPPAAKESAHAHELELPDGTFVPALNDAVDPAPLQQYWGNEVPWSPIVGVERNTQGVDWYRHANGSFSTTQRVWRSDRQQWVSMTRVGHPGPAVTPAVAR